VLKSNLLKNSMRGYGKYFITGIASVLFVALFSYISPLILSFLVDYVLGNDDSSLPALVKEWTVDKSSGYFLDNIWLIALLFVICTGLGGLFTFIKQFCSANVSEGISKNMRDYLYDHIQNAKYDYFKHVSAGDIVQRCTSDINTIRRFVSVQFFEVVRTFVMVIIAVTIMIRIDSLMTLLSVILLPFMFVFSLVFFSRVKERFTLSDEAEGRIMTVLQENVSGVRVVRAFGRQADEIRKFEEKDRDYRDITYNMAKLLGLYWGTSDGIGYLQIAVTIVCGIIFVAKGRITLGEHIMFSTYAGMITWPVRQLGRILTDMGKASVSIGRLDEIMEVEIESEPGKNLTVDIKGNIEFENVCFGYDDGDDDVLKNITFSVKKGQTVAVIGSTGSGKTSLVHLLQRLYPVSSGRITIDGVDINDINLKCLRSNIGIVLQEPFLYSRSIIDNIRIFRPEASEEEVYEASRLASVHDVISEFKDGYDTVVGERGVTLSGGQKQRVAIARTLMQKAPVVIFDDSMSAVDTQTDAAIREGLKTLRKDTTTFIISHRISTVCDADLIVVLDNGRIVQKGNHEQLINQDGLYADIAKLQSYDEYLKETEAIQAAVE